MLFNRRQFLTVAAALGLVPSIKKPSAKLPRQDAIIVITGRRGSLYLFDVHHPMMPGAVGWTQEAKSYGDAVSKLSKRFLCSMDRIAVLEEK